ncbi:protein kinase [Microbacterium sp. 2P01SA-2]|uniref:protein kinase n=1 Tax=unclassified Microbacterium TaxID=2609290 RepID=UPI0039A02825
MTEPARRSRHPLPAPGEIDARRPDRLLASSARADVYLYRDAEGRSPAAVKVFRDPLDRSEREAFAGGAARLVALSTHPSVATVQSVGTTDEGRPYLVMEYCSRADLAETASRRPMSVPEALRLLIRLCGAVETAHRNGIAHGRVGIENVLTTDYGWPAMIGFDRDNLLRRDEPGASAAVRATDVHGLAVAATELLTGRPVAESASSLSGADEVPVELETLVLATLEAAAADRAPSAAEFGLALQRVEADQHIPITHLDVRDPDASGPTDAPADDEDERTVLSNRHAPADEHTVLARRRRADTDVEAGGGGGDGDDERTVLADRRRGPVPGGAMPMDTEDHTVLSTRSIRPDDDRTVLSTRGTDPDDEHTRLAARSLPAPEDPPAPPELPASDADPEPTAFVRRQRRDDLVRGRVDTARQAVGPDGDGERYRVRTTPDLAEVSRVRVEAPVRQPPTTAAPRRRGRGTVVVVIGVGAVVLGAAATAVVMMIGGGA